MFSKKGQMGNLDFAGHIWSLPQSSVLFCFEQPLKNAKSILSCKPFRNFLTCGPKYATPSLVCTRHWTVGIKYAWSLLP